MAIGPPEPGQGSLPARACVWPFAGETACGPLSPKPRVAPARLSCPWPLPAQTGCGPCPPELSAALTRPNWVRPLPARVARGPHPPRLGAARARPSWPGPFPVGAREQCDAAWVACILAAGRTAARIEASGPRSRPTICRLGQPGENDGTCGPRPPLEPRRLALSDRWGQHRVRTTTPTNKWPEYLPHRSDRARLDAVRAPAAYAPDSESDHAVTARRRKPSGQPSGIVNRWCLRGCRCRSTNRGGMISGMPSGPMRTCQRRSSGRSPGSHRL